MSLDPAQTLVEKNLSGLGLKLNNSGKKNCTFSIEEIKKDPK